jgi:molybdopterin-guanine dinucleotide biosynthesis protein A
VTAFCGWTLYEFERHADRRRAFAPHGRGQGHGACRGGTSLATATPRLERSAAGQALGVAWTKPHWCPPEIEAVADNPPSCGPLSGLAAGLRRLGTSHLLVLAIDMPQMTAEHLRKLWGLARPGIGFLPLAGDCFESLCAVYPAEAVTSAEAALNGADWSLQHFAQKLVAQSQARVYSLTHGERRLHLNMNTPSDLLTIH